MTEHYVGTDSVFDCPFSEHQGISTDPDYVYVRKFNFKQKENEPIVYDRDVHAHDHSINILYLNGEIEQMERSLLEQ